MDGTVKEKIMDYLAGKLTCKEVTEAVTEYLEGTFTFWERVRFQMHLNGIVLNEGRGQFLSLMN